jgi:uncharacterized membrane protein YeaQ/YmgE (transglycosylase-associated protein family)
MVNLVVLIVVGGIVGWIASIIAKTNAQMGLIANILVGIVGSALGFWLAGLLGLAAYGVLARGLVAVAGAVILIVILRAVGLFK